MRFYDVMPMLFSLLQLKKHKHN